MSNFIVTVLLILAIATANGVTNSDDGHPSFKITTKRNDDRVDVNVEKDKAIFSIHSPFGISHAVIERTGEEWPDAVLLRLHLKGLENVRASNGDVKLEASTSLQDGKPLVRIGKDGKEDRPLDSKSPC